MAYLALYRRFRPNGFQGLIGQDHVVRTLTNQIETGRIGHAYLFCGARGTGKTSAAKIFARAINCLSPVDGSPCGKCEACRALADPSNLDILEMDAASNNKVENVREIRDKIQYPPVSGKYKVYIIDEVHMLTTEAFNALLKTLEEPPKHAVFILATTEVHKLPSTILSRCMRFDFRLIPTGEIASLIGRIYREIGKEYDEEAVTAIAKAGAGSVRDALSIADICVSYRDGKLTYADVLEILGATDSAKITETLDCIFSSRTGEMLETVESLADSGKSIGVLCRDLISRLRELIVCKTCRTAKELLGLPEDVFDGLKKLADSVDEHRLLRTVEIFSEAEASLRYSQTPRVLLEAACIKAAQPADDYNIDALIARVSALEKMLENGVVSVKTEASGSINGKIDRFADPFANASADAAGQEENREKTSPSERKGVPSAEERGRDAGEPPLEEPPVDEPVPPPELPEDFLPPVGMKPRAAEVRPAAKPVPDAAAGNGKESVRPIGDGREKEEAERPAPTPNGGMSASRLWGTVIRKLRAGGNIMLWVACQEMKATLSGRTLRIVAQDAGGYQAITKESNLAVLSETVRSVGDYEVEVVMEGEEREGDRTEAAAKEMERKFGVPVRIE
ncbi:MAG: DNA polymerase III subunit gamma/tau [Candidatus Borkfalkiaceae bacterium]|nr:DNA polymerase III subunit gamma/tau [Christensenellaceae bacterium]